MIEKVGKGVEVIAKLSKDDNNSDGQIVAARQGRLLVTAFHPELTSDDRFHRLFLSMVET